MFVMSYCLVVSEAILFSYSLCSLAQARLCVAGLLVHRAVSQANVYYVGHIAWEEHGLQSETDLGLNCSSPAVSKMGIVLLLLQGLYENRTNVIKEQAWQRLLILAVTSIL